jgi:hypothetical protein
MTYIAGENGGGRLRKDSSSLLAKRIKHKGGEYVAEAVVKQSKFKNYLKKRDKPS